MFDKLFEIFSNSQSSVTINGKTIVGNNISFQNGAVYVDGKLNHEIKDYKIDITVNGDCEKVHVGSGSVKVNGVTGSVNTGSGDIAAGNVSGNVTVGGGNVTCKSVTGSVKTGAGDINLKA